MSDGFDELRRLELDLLAAPAEAGRGIEKAVKGALMTGKKAWRASAAARRFSGKYPASIDYDIRTPSGFGVTEIQGEVGPNLGRGVGLPGLGIVEDSPGRVHGAPQRNYLKAEEAMGPDLEHGIEVAIEQAHRKLRL